MARKTSNPSPRVLTGLILALALADFNLAKTIGLENAGKPEDGSRNDESINYDYRELFSRMDGAPLPEDSSSLAGKEEKRRVDDPVEKLKSKDETSDEEALINATDSSLEMADALQDPTTTTTTVRAEPERFTVRRNDQVIPTTPKIGSGELPTPSNGEETSEKEEAAVGSRFLAAGTTPAISNGSRHDGEEKVSSSTIAVRQEFEAEEEEDSSEGHTGSELAEATTPSSKSWKTDSRNIFGTSHSNIESLDVEESDDGSTISLASDTVVNHRVDSENETGNFRRNDFGTTLSHEPKNQVEVFAESGHPAVLRISEAAANYTDVYGTTPNSSPSKPKGRTIAISGDNEVTANQTTLDAGLRSFPKKSVSTEKPILSKPYPYSKAENRPSGDRVETVTEMPNVTERATEEISAYENTIGSKKTDEKIIVTEPSVLVENSIQQLKPVHDKRSGNQSRVNSTLDASVAGTVWSLAATGNAGLRNASENIDGEPTTSPANRGRAADNDVPQGNLANVTTTGTERTPTILSEVTENNIETVIGRTNGNGSRSTAVSGLATSARTSDAFNGEDPEPTEKMGAISVTPTTNRGAGIDREESGTTVDRSNPTDEIPTESYSPPEGSPSTSREFLASSGSDGSEKPNRESETTSYSTMEYDGESSSEASTTEEEIANAAGSTSNAEEPTTVEYEFVGLTDGANSTTTRGYPEKSSGRTDAVTGSTQTPSEMTETVETIATEGGDDERVTEENETITLSRNVESISITTPSFDETTATAGGDTIDDITTPSEDTNDAASPSASEVSFTTGTTDVYPDTTASSTSPDGDNPPGQRADFTTSGPSYDPQEINATVTIIAVPVTTDEPTAVSNVEVIVSSEGTTAFQEPVTLAPRTTVQIETTTTDAPEFTIFTEDVSFFVRIIIEGNWSDVCPHLAGLRAALANLLTERTDRSFSAKNIIMHQTQCSSETAPSTSATPVLLYVVDDNGDFDYTMTERLPNLYKESPFAFPLTIHSVEKLILETESNNNAIAVIAVSSVAFVCLVILAGLLFIMRKRQTRFNYGERCRPVSLDSYRVDSVSAYNSVRRKDLARASKRSYGNPAFEDSSVTPTHPLNFAGLSSFCNDINAITEEFAGIPQVSARIDELPSGAEVKNRYANVVPLPETRVPLQKINNEPLTEYINASYVRGPKNATKYYIACQAPIESTVADFWRMIWEQQSKVIIMLTDIIENGVEKCVDYIPPSEVTDCHRLYGDYQVTLKKHEAKEKYAISTLHLKNLENSTYREVSHIWYLWPTNGVPSDATGLIAILLEARALQRGAPGPIVVHCSPGTGRTGTLIALDLGIRQYEITRTVDVPRVVYTIRRDRAGAVQTKEQYAFIYKALNLYAAKLAGGALESM